MARRSTWRFVWRGLLIFVLLMVADFLAAAALCLIEWPSRAAGLLPPASLRLSLQIVDEERRLASLETSEAELQKGLEQALAISFISV
jgi:tRNA A37 threonylcarbamoyladenosine biosynthesis protein TsaE